jgi:signal transduction histidine kinase
MLTDDSPRAAGYDRTALLGVIADESARLDRILTDFLAFARPREPVRLPHSVNDLVREVLTSLQLDRLGQSRPVDTALQAGLPPVPIDADQIKQAVWNVVRNALEATQPGDALRVATAARNGQVVVEVADAGPGIPSDQQARLFEPFQTSKPGGSGLGLAIAHRIVAAHGGAIEIETAAGAGTRVRITLPREAP